MYGVNLDLLRAAATRHDEAYSHHRAAHLEALTKQRQLARAKWMHRIGARLARLVPFRPKLQRATTPAIFCPEVSQGGPGV